jgi:hypothetical protein
MYLLKSVATLLRDFCAENELANRQLGGQIGELLVFPGTSS